MFGNNNNKLQESRYGYKVDEQGRYVENLEHIRGNAATGEQVHSVRNIQTDKPMTFEEMKNHWDEMNREAKEWLDNNPGQSANFITSRDTNGNEIISVFPEKDLIFSGSNLVAVYDKKGNKIIGQENIIKEVQRRRAERDQWIREGKLENTFDEIHHTDDGWTSKVKFMAYPGQLHPNEVKAETDLLIGLATEKRQRQLGNSNNQEFSEEVPKLVDISNSSSMEIDKPENSLTPISNKIFTDNEIAKASKDELTDLVERILNELENRKSGEVVNYQEFSDQELEDQTRNLEVVLNRFSVDNSPQPSNSVLPILGVAVVASLASGLMFWKRNKNK